jgi:hypothetical protein
MEVAPGLFYALRRMGLQKHFEILSCPESPIVKCSNLLGESRPTHDPMSAHVEMHNSFAIFNFSIQFIKIKLPIISTRQFHLIMWTETAVHFSTMSLLLPVSSFTEMLVFVNT